MGAIVLERVTKKFGEKIAVSEVSLEIRAGAFVGLLGRNGAGKSTTLKMLTGLLEPTSGSIRILGQRYSGSNESALAIKKRIGVMPEDMALLEMLTGPQYLRFVGRMYGLDDATIDARRAELFE